MNLYKMEQNKTAIEWLLEKQYELNMNNSLSKKQYIGRRIKNQNQAKEMFKEQILEAYRTGFAEAWCMFNIGKKYFHTSAEQYYKENFNEDAY